MDTDVALRDFLIIVLLEYPLRIARRAFLLVDAIITELNVTLGHGHFNKESHELASSVNVMSCLTSLCYLKNPTEHVSSTMTS